MGTPQLSWDWGTGYDLFISLGVLHEPDKFGLRGAWAAGVRSRLPAEERDALQLMVDSCGWPLHWVYTLPKPKNSHTMLSALTEIPVRQRLPALTITPYIPLTWQEVLHRVMAHGMTMTCVCYRTM